MGKGSRRVNTCKNYVHLYVNAKMITVETIPGIGVVWVNSFMMYY
jgi:hypothetical protein